MDNRKKWDRELWVMVGLPRSGKSTWARKWYLPIVSSDAVREALHGERFLSKAEPYVHVVKNTMIEALFLAGHTTVIVDECHVKRKYRQALEDLGVARCVYIVLGTPKEECLARANEAGDDVIVPVIERMAEEWEELSSDEETAGNIVCVGRFV